MGRITGFLMRTALLSGGIFLLSPAFPRISHADIFRWVDSGGVVHFTDNPANIPEKYRTGKTMILKSPPSAGQPSVSTLGGGAPGGPFMTSPPPSEEPAPPEREDHSGEAEELRSRIAAKEKFIKGIDLKRSRALHPLGNRFVSPEDLELYRRYSEELPKDRERLREISPSSP